MTSTPGGNSERWESPFEPQEIDLNRSMSEGGIVFFAFVPSEIEEADFEKKWWPLLEGFPFNILYSSTRQGQNMKPAMASALYEPDLATFRGTDSVRELTYFNKQAVTTAYA